MKRNNRKLLWFSIIIGAYFLALYLIWFYKVDATIVGVFQELLTIPMMIAQLILLVFIGKLLINPQQRTSANICTLIISLTTTILIIQSF